MPTIQVPLKSWTEIQALKKSKRFKKLSDEALALAVVEKIVKARRSEISLELYDFLEDTIPDGAKSIDYDHAELNIDGLLAAVTTLIENAVDEDAVIERAMLTAKAGGPSKSLDKALLFSYPIPCANPKCKTVNHFPADAYAECQKSGEDRRPGVSVKLPGEKGNDGD
jgi:hypothetical protein